jgi:hypothetical protein
VATNPSPTASDDLRLPMGKYIAPIGWNAATTQGHMRDIAELPARLRTAVEGLSDQQLDTPYRPGGWTIRQLVHHIPDSHLNAYCRFRLALTEDEPTIVPYQEALWAELPDAQSMSTAPSLMLLDGLHQRWVGLMHAMTAAQWQRGFIHPEHARRISLWETAALYGWHSRHHVAHITAAARRHGW